MAWVSTLSVPASQTWLLFRFSMSVRDPPLLGFAPGMRSSKKLRPNPTGEPKDTLCNVRETKEFVVNIVTYELAEAMNLTSGEYARPDQ